MLDDENVHLGREFNLQEFNKMSVLNGSINSWPRLDIVDLALQLGLCATGSSKDIIAHIKKHFGVSTEGKRKAEKDENPLQTNEKKGKF